MAVTLLLTFLVIADVLVVILVGVATIPAHRVMRTMPKEIQEATKDHPVPRRLILSAWIGGSLPKPTFSSISIRKRKEIRGIIILGLIKRSS